MMKAARSTVVLVAVMLAGCSGTPELSTGSLFGSGEKPKPVGPVNDPSVRAFQVGTVSARAIKCGFNFDPAKLKTNYLAYERALAPTADLRQIEKTYDVSFNGVAKAVAGQSNYCTDAKTKKIKADLARHLAGDYAPSASPKKQEEGGLFSGWWGSGDSDNKSFSPSLPTDNSNI
jgi:hypothetical protein